MLRTRSFLSIAALAAGLAGWASAPADGADAQGEMDRRLGQALFERAWVAAPASTDSADGLGPLYNARSCSGCHPRGGLGRAVPTAGPAPAALVLHLGVQFPTALGRSTQGPESNYGRQIQTLALPGQVVEGRVEIRYQTFAVPLGDGTQVTLRRPSYRIQELGYGPLHQDVRISPRLAPPLAGVGLLEPLAETDILALADPDDRDGDGISGRPHWIWDQAQGRHVLGRFGWKAEQPNLEAQVQAAFSLDLGMATVRHPRGAGDCTRAQTLCLAAPQGNSPLQEGVEAGPRISALVTHYTAGLAVAPRRDRDKPRIRAGEALFARLGCANCHRPEFSAAGRTISPYSDLLLHDLGADLGDGPQSGDGLEREWRTQPLWGLGAAANRADGGGFLHDGRARTPLEAILWHGGEARSSRNSVLDLTGRERADLLAFLQSL